MQQKFWGELVMRHYSVGPKSLETILSNEQTEWHAVVRYNEAVVFKNIYPENRLDGWWSAGRFDECEFCRA